MAVGEILRFRAIASSSAGETPAYNYYVDPVYGLDTNNGLTTKTPFKTIAAAATAVGSSGNKTVGLMSGSYGDVDVSSTFSAETVFRSIVTHGAVFDSLVGTGMQHCTFRNIRVLKPAGDTAYPNPNNAPNIVTLTSPTDVKLDGCRIGSAAMLRTFYGVKTAGTKAVRVTISDCEIENTGAGVRWSTGGTDCTVEDTTIHGIVGSALGNQGLNSTGLIYRRNTVYDQWKRPDDPEWTTGGAGTGTWEEVHASLIAVRDAQDVTIEDNLVYSVSLGFMQFYAGESGETYEYGDISIKRNLFYDIGESSATFSLLPTDTSRVGKFEIEHNTIVNGEEPGWNAASYTQLRERFYDPIFNVGTLGALQTGDTCKNNLIIGRVGMASWSNNNVCWVDTSGSPGTNNIYVEASHNADPDWVTDQLVAGTWIHAPAAEGTIRAGYTFTPAIGSTLATAGEGGTYVGATAPA